MDLLEQFKQITTFILDVDGVLTDGSLLVLDDGQMVRRMNIKDGYAIQLALKKGYRVVVITGGNSEAVRERLNKLGVADVFIKVVDKKQMLVDYVMKNHLSWNEVLFMGDDIPDFVAMQMVGLPCAPSDAAPEIQRISKYISPIGGGYGCVRDVIEKVLKLNNNWLMDTTVPGK